MGGSNKHRPITKEITLYLRPTVNSEWFPVSNVVNFPDVHNLHAYKHMYPK